MASEEKHTFLESQAAKLNESQGDFLQLLEATEKMATGGQAVATASEQIGQSLYDLIQSDFADRLRETVKPAETKNYEKQKKRMNKESIKRKDTVNKAKQAWDKQKKPKSREKKKKKFEETFNETDSWLESNINRIKYENESRFKNLGGILRTVLDEQSKLLASHQECFDQLPPAALSTKAANIPRTDKGETAATATGTEATEVSDIPPPDSPPPTSTSTAQDMNGGPPPTASDYGAPPATGGDYGSTPVATGNNYGAPPPPGGEFGAPPPPGGEYSAPLPGNDYGAPPPPGEEYGAPPPPEEEYYEENEEFAPPPPPEDDDPPPPPPM